MLKRLGLDTIMVLIAWAWIAICIFAGAGCGDNARGPVDLLDGGPGDDAACEVDAADTGCCALYPDEDAVRACAKDSFPVGACGVVACQKADCSFARVNVCHLEHCADLACVALACDENTPPGCTCELADHSYVSCVGD